MEAPLIISVSGVRGIVGESLTPKEASEFGMAYGTFLKQQHPAGPIRVCIGRDSRPSGSMMAAAVGAGVMAAGCDVYDLGIVTTPGTAIMVRHLQCAGGIVITASHNPIEWNGIKFLRDDGIAFPAEQAKKIQQVYFDKAFDLQNAEHTGCLTTNDESHGVHIDKVTKICDPALIASKHFKVVLDSINGAGCVVTAQLLSQLGCEVIHLNGRPTGIFAHKPEPTAENLADLGQEIIKHKAAIGFAQDPDADRLALIDEKGAYIGEEYTLALIAQYIFSKKKGVAAANLSTSRMIDDIAAAANCSVIRTPVGEAHVANTMVEKQCVIGGEGNGGIIDLRVVPVRDSLVGIALMLQYLAESGKTVSELVAQIPRYELLKTKFPCPQGQAGAVLDKVADHYQKLADKGEVRVDTRDGIRVDLADGWVQLRASNTEPIVRLMAEFPDPQRSQSLVDEVKAIAGL